jgi:hypothetical protein
MILIQNTYLSTYSYSYEQLMYISNFVLLDASLSKMCQYADIGKGSVKNGLSYVLSFYSPKSCFRILISIWNLNQHLELQFKF